MRIPKVEADSKRDQVLAMHRAGKKNTEIALELNIHKNSVWGYLERAGIKLVRPKRTPLKKKKVLGKRIEVRTCKTCAVEKPISAFGNTYNQQCSACFKAASNNKH